ncbi:MAG: hypothetical protein LH702_13360 [Phormidesmis sp. CAN_BIN44]|nr:hypothetical protein [Phormidesmis sp. CAN_BIN44]
MLDRPLLEYKHDQGRVVVLLEDDVDPDDMPTAEEHCSSHLSHIRLTLSLSSSPI